MTEQELVDHCERLHRPLENRIDRLDGRMWSLIIIAIVQLAGIATTLAVLFVQNGRG